MLARAWAWAKEHPGYAAVIVVFAVFILLWLLGYFGKTTTSGSGAGYDSSYSSSLAAYNAEIEIAKIQADAKTAVATTSAGALKDYYTVLTSITSSQELTSSTVASDYYTALTSASTNKLLGLEDTNSATLAAFKTSSSDAVTIARISAGTVDSNNNTSTTLAHIYSDLSATLHGQTTASEDYIAALNTQAAIAGGAQAEQTAESLATISAGVTDYAAAIKLIEDKFTSTSFNFPIPGKNGTIGFASGTDTSGGFDFKLPTL